MRIVFVFACFLLDHNLPLPLSQDLPQGEEAGFATEAEAVVPEGKIEKFVKKRLKNSYDFPGDIKNLFKQRKDGNSYLSCCSGDRIALGGI